VLVEAAELSCGAGVAVRSATVNGCLDVRELKKD
jgi:hypothetical protein